MRAGRAKHLKFARLKAVVIGRVGNLPLYGALIREFSDRTGMPVIMNTSFNLRREPIICTPTDAIRTFFSSGVHSVVIDIFVVEK